MGYLTWWDNGFDDNADLCPICKQELDDDGECYYCGYSPSSDPDAQPGGHDDY